MKRLLFFAETVTQAHFFRPFCVAKRLDPARFEIHFAAREGHRAAVEKAGFRFHPIDSLSSERFLNALRTGSPPYDLETLRAYVRQDEAIIAQVRPQALISDFRLSLPVVSERHGIPLATITNAHWAPWAKVRWPLPDYSGIPGMGFLPLPAAKVIFRLGRPFSFASFLRPLNRLRKENHQPEFSSLGDAYTYGDVQLLDDVPGLIPTQGEPPVKARYCGPLIEDQLAGLPTRWPEGWDLSAERRRDRPRAYISMGSSGSLAALTEIIEAIKSLGWEALMATAGRFEAGTLPPGFRSAPMVPGALCASACDVVITNGGSAPCYQALSQGTPILALPTNMDQYLFSEALERKGLALLLRAERARANAIAETVRRLAGESHFREATRAFSARITDLRAKSVATQALSELGPVSR
ncbi:MAG: hypothetical protein NDJ90_06920 [Oligoflexia bacterium]|nr:hypothetical protein [Oligoflexia bacterium]